MSTTEKLMDPELADRARRTLSDLVDHDQSWRRVHAAEILLEYGAAERIRTIFLAEPASGEGSRFRVGIWRVLARTAQSAEERGVWITRIEGVYLDRTAPDRFQALECLCKLGVVATSGALRSELNETSCGASADDAMLARWALILAGEPSALSLLEQGLASESVDGRLCAAYALRWLRPENPNVLRALARAAEQEPSGSKAYPFLLGAALSLSADPDQASDWEAKLLEVIESGSEVDCWEVCQALKGRITSAQLPRFVRLLDSPEGDKRAGGALVILHCARES